MHYQHRNPYRERDHRISLMPLAREARDAGEPPLWLGASVVALLAIAALFAIVAFTKPPAGSLAHSGAEPHTSVAEAGAGNGEGAR